MADYQATRLDPQLDNSARSGVAIVAEGGGQRGIFTAGVLDAFLEQKCNPFELGIGVSAGAQNLLIYFLGELGYAKKVIEELTMVPDFFVPYRWLGERGVVDLDQYFETTVSDPEYQLPYQRIDKIQQLRKLIFVATNQETLQPVYLEPDKQSVLTYLKASSAIPFLYKEPVEIGQQQLVDGGVADPLPVVKAIEMGAKYIVVIRTVCEKTVHSSWREYRDTKQLRRVLPDSVAQMLEAHDSANDRAVEVINKPPDGVNIINITPDVPLQSKVLGSSSAAIVEDYNMGRRVGAAAVDTLQHWLPEQD